MRTPIAFCINALAAALIALVSQTASAQPSATNVLASCSVVVVPIAFLGYNPLSYDDMNNDTGSIGLKCSSPTAGTVGYSIGLDKGQGTFVARTMKNATGASLNYNLFTMPNYSSVWGDGLTGSSVVSGSYPIPGGSVQTDSVPLRIYARVFKRQLLPPGDYSDNMLVSIIF
jgi:spore coat protein U-like protein